MFRYTFRYFKQTGRKIKRTDVYLAHTLGWLPWLTFGILTLQPLVSLGIVVSTFQLRKWRAEAAAPGQHSVGGNATKRAWVSSIACLASFPPRGETSCLQTALSEDILSDALASTNSGKRPLATTPCHSSFLPRLWHWKAFSCACGERISILANLSRDWRLFAFTSLPGSLRDFRHSCFSLPWKLQLVSWGLIHLSYDSTLIQRIFFNDRKTYPVISSWH